MLAFVLGALQQLALWLLAVLLLIGEYLDWFGRLEVLEVKHPKVHRFVNSRPLRLVLLLLVFSMLATDLKTNLKELEVPVPVYRWPDTSVRYVAPIVRENYELRQELAALTKPEPSNSLRRRTIGLANELDNYVRMRWENHPSRICEGSPVQNPTPQQQRDMETCGRYDRETWEHINAHFKEDWISMVKQYDGLGIKVGFLVNDMEQNHPAQNTYMPFFPAVDNGTYASAQEKFRELAYHVTATGERVDIKPSD